MESSLYPPLHRRHQNSAWFWYYKPVTFMDEQDAWALVQQLPRELQTLIMRQVLLRRGNTTLKAYDRHIKRGMEGMDVYFQGSPLYAGIIKLFLDGVEWGHKSNPYEFEDFLTSMGKLPFPVLDAMAFFTTYQEGDRPPTLYETQDQWQTFDGEGIDHPIRRNFEMTMCHKNPEGHLTALVDIYRTGAGDELTTLTHIEVEGSSTSTYAVTNIYMYLAFDRTKKKSYCIHVIEGHTVDTSYPFTARRVTTYNWDNEGEVCLEANPQHTYMDEWVRSTPTQFTPLIGPRYSDRQWSRKRGWAMDWKYVEVSPRLARQLSEYQLLTAMAIQETLCYCSVVGGTERYLGFYSDEREVAMEHLADTLDLHANMDHNDQLISIFYMVDLLRKHVFTLVNLDPQSLYYIITISKSKELNYGFSNNLIEKFLQSLLTPP